MNSIRLTALIIVLLCAIDNIQGKPTGPSLNHLDDNIKYLLKLTGVENEYLKFLSYIKLYPPADDRMKALYNDLFSFDSFISDLIEVYTKQYTSDDINQLISFYSSPLGKKVNQVTHALDKEMEDVMLNKVSDYMLTLSENGFEVTLPQVPH
ncbi:unnamed protein product [Rotaria magnacalcarata]|uniref:DUF2059 domain-containing protein n=2 Tax=Rotaria magnacalcarata TaxID=392030 RepID=A0A816XGM9_9BILA|nr:unnamed protein product [Rotaria magnacalcarata]CAF1627950.1 unnamed protein product [Rotaria magnacalcarata]CAF2145975.1 unnamed protein product [Rotaria magnacalcarata]CAF2161658.1 unnamed protein product [Rotaria magnacalcarata]CAF2179752.1 unnamed protein product [Rotaria magnacalcarata]